MDMLGEQIEFIMSAGDLWLCSRLTAANVDPNQVMGLQEAFWSACSTEITQKPNPHENPTHPSDACNTRVELQASKM